MKPFRDQIKSHFGKRETRFFLLLLLLPILISGFQNCSPGFKTKLEEASSVSLNSQSPHPNPTPAPTPTPMPLPNQPKNLDCPPSQQVALSFSETCLGKALNSGVQYANVIEYTPQYPLFSDGASKRRWIYLPPGSKIDTSNPNEWIFPVGTILWKEFSIGPNKIETRQTEKLATQNWRFSVYLWRRDQKTAERVETIPQSTDFTYSDVRSRYAAPPVNQCTTCHAGSTDRVLGFSYLQLSHATPGTFGINQLKLSSWLSQPPSDLDRIQSRPGDNGLQAAALGYMHSNCSSCHGPHNSNLPNFRHVSGTLSADQEMGYRSLVSRNLINLSNPSGSIILSRMNSATNPMPPRFSHLTVDSEAIALIQKWIQNLAVGSTAPR